LFKKNCLHLVKLAQLLLLFIFLSPLSVQAYTGITIVMSTATSNNLEFVDEFKAELAADKTHTLKVNLIDLSKEEKLIVAENSELVIALGVKALEASSKLKHTTPVLGVFTPLPTFNQLLFKSGRRLGIFSAIVLDQPYKRQIGLAKIALPEAKNLGILLGSTSTRYEDFLREAAERHGFNVEVEEVNSSSALIPKLEKIFETNDVLLAIPDPLVYNRETAQPILLTSYRHQVPVFGYSRSYVKAGALASVFSNAKHLAKQAAEIAIETQITTGLLPPPQVPKYFSVIINRQVERSLNLHLADENDIYQKLLALEANSPAGVVE
jgi:putative tryptophan/tyrosine transport system substrate-binding protein